MYVEGDAIPSSDLNSLLLDKQKLVSTFSFQNRDSIVSQLNIEENQLLQNKTEENILQKAKHTVRAQEWISNSLVELTTLSEQLGMTKQTNNNNEELDSIL